MADATRRPWNLDRRAVALGGLATLAPTRLAWAQGGRVAPGGACLLTPQATEGPFYFDPKLERADIRAGRPGTPVRLVIGVQGADCRPLPGARVDVWHCDAGGVYSGFGGGGGRGETFLRGHQPTNAAGEAAFTTIYPGWYPGRTPHIHLKVILASQHVLTTQLYFPDALSDRIYRAAPYARPGRRRTNGDDFIARRQGPRAVAAVTPSGNGYVVRLVVGVDPRARL